MAMSKPKPISVFNVGVVCAALHGGAAVLFVPIFSFILLCWGTTPAQVQPSVISGVGMVLAIVAPALCAVFGFVAGALVALAHNVFAQNQRKAAVEVRRTHQVRAASLSNVA